MRYSFQRQIVSGTWQGIDHNDDLKFIESLFLLYNTNWPNWKLEIIDNETHKVICATFTIEDLFAYNGSYEDFSKGSHRYYAQLAVDHYGVAIRDNNHIPDLVAIGENLDEHSIYK